MRRRRFWRRRFNPSAPDANAHADTNAHADSYANTNANPDTNPDAYSSLIHRDYGRCQRAIRKQGRDLS